MQVEKWFGALFASSENFEESIVFQNALKSISELFSSNDEFKNALLSPSVNDSEKLEIIREIFKEESKNEKFVNWITEVIRKNRMNEIDTMSDEYSMLNNSLKERIEELKEKFPEYGKDSTFTNFLIELLRKDKIEQIESMSDVNRDSLNKELKIKIVVASELSDEQLNGIVNKFKEMYKAETVKYTIELDKSIIGGIKVCVGNTIYDNTIDTRLKQIF